MFHTPFQTMCTESDLKDLGLPMGPRKKLQGILKEEQAKKVPVLLHTTRIFLINTVGTFYAFLNVFIIM